MQLLFPSEPKSAFFKAVSSNGTKFDFPLLDIGVTLVTCNLILAVYKLPANVLFLSAVYK